MASLILRSVTAAAVGGKAHAAHSLTSVVRCLSAAAKADLGMIKELREQSGAPVKDVKAALEEGGWDMDAAFQALRKRGLAAAAKKDGRAAEEGLVAVAEGTGASTVVEINCETDFVARNDKFQSLMTAVAQAALSTDPSSVDPKTFAVSADGIAAIKMPGGESVADAVAEVAGTVRENVQFCRAFKMETSGVVCSYMHTSPSPGLGRIGAILSLEAADGSVIEGDFKAQAQDLGKKIAMHVVAAKPLFLDRSAVTPEALEAEKKMLSEQALASGKPANLVEKMVMGRLGKYYEEFCLLDQKFVMDDSVTVAKFLKSASKSAGKELKLTQFLRVAVGESSVTAENSS